MGASAQNVDFSNVKEASGFNRSRIKAGDYLAKIKGVEDAKAKDGVHQYLFSIQIVDKPSSVFPYYCKLQENQLWKLRNLFIAAGKTVPKTAGRNSSSRLPATSPTTNGFVPRAKSFHGCATRTSLNTAAR